MLGRGEKSIQIQHANTNFLNFQEKFWAMAALANFKHGKKKKVLITMSSKPSIFINALFHLVLNTNDMPLRFSPLRPECDSLIHDLICISDFSSILFNACVCLNNITVKNLLKVLVEAFYLNDWLLKWILILYFKPAT